MLLSRMQIEAFKVSSPDETRRNICAVLIEPSGEVVATDGHRLVIVPGPELNETDFPVVPETLGEITEPVLVPRSFCEKVLKALPKGKRIFPILKCAKVGMIEGKIVAFVSDGEDMQRFSTEPVGGKFPDYRQVVPGSDTMEKEYNTVIGVDAQYLKEMAEMAAKFGDSPVAVKLSVKDQNHALVCEFVSERGEKVKHVIMPVRL